jgi:hypothetical protein
MSPTAFPSSPYSSSVPGTVDAHGRPVAAGTRVRVIAIDDSLLHELAPLARERVGSMRGQCFTVYEVDGHGHAWVERWWHAGDDQATSHSLALQPRQMEIC